MKSIFIISNVADASTHSHAVGEDDNYINMIQINRRIEKIKTNDINEFISSITPNILSQPRAAEPAKSDILDLKTAKSDISDLKTAAERASLEADQARAAADRAIAQLSTYFLNFFHSVSVEMFSKIFV